MDAKKLNASAEESKLPSSGRPRSAKALKVFEHDLPDTLAKKLLYHRRLTLDTETGGLDPHSDPLLLVQLCTVDRRVYFVRRPDWSSENLIRVLTWPFSEKVFHHAGFDLRFLKTGTGAELEGPIHCTRTLMKITNPRRACGLGAAVKRFFGVQLDKEINHDHWNAETLSPRQLEYAAGDVLYLDPLCSKLLCQLTPPQIHVYQRAMSSIEESAYNDVEGYPDLLTYRKDKGVEVVAKRHRWKSMKSRE